MDLIVIPEKPDGTLVDHEYFCIHDDLCGRTQSTHQDKISCASLYEMNEMKTNLKLKQQRYVMTRSKIRRGVLPNNYPTILFRERGKKLQLTIGTNHLMTSG